LLTLARQLGVTDDIALPGFVENPFAYMARASVFVLSSAWEGFGNVIAEALACGCPVVSTDCPSGPAEILEHGKYGPLVPVGRRIPGDAIFAVLSTPPDRDRLRARSAMFSADYAAEQYLRALLGPAQLI
jgi:glycosyltransferase involved in cell wall biosynthesis